MDIVSFDFDTVWGSEKTQLLDVSGSVYSGRRQCALLKDGQSARYSNVELSALVGASPRPERR